MAEASRIFRVSLQAKVLAAVLGFLVLLPVITLWIVDRHMRQQMEEEALRTLATAEGVFLKSLDNRSRNVLSRYRSVVAEKRFEVTAGLADPKTMAGLLAKVQEDSPEDHELFLFYAAGGELLAGQHRAGSADLEGFAHASAAFTQAALSRETSLGSVGLGGRAYSVVSVPVAAQNDGALAGVLTVGVRIGEMTLREIQLSRTEILLVVEGKAILSTVKGAEIAGSLLRAASTEKSPEGSDQTVQRVILAGEHFMARSGELEGSRIGPAGIRYVMLSSYEQQLHALEATRRTVMGLSAAVILLSALVVSWFVSRVTRPLRELRDNAEAVGRGDFSRKITHFSNDECGELAETFNRMTGNLQGARADLEKTVDTLKTTQTQLIQSEKLSAVGQFVAGVAHELNNPLTAVIGFSDYLFQTADPKTAPQLEIIMKSAQRCHKIVESLLGFARQHPPERKLIQVNVTIDEVLEIMAYDFRTSNIKVVREYQANLPVITADPHQLQQVFINILSNARQAIQPIRREGTITLRTRVTGASIRIEMEDNGPGIRPEHLSRIFDPFFTTKPVGKGTGLGMSLSYGIIHEHGGKISVRSELGQGAIFTIELPVAITGPATRGGSMPPYSPKPVVPAGKVVLVVDDEDWILTLAVTLLRSEGYEVLTAPRGEKALELIASRKIDVIVCDWKMPGLNGIQLYEHLCAINPVAASRMIFMTGDVISDTFQEFLQRSSKNCLAKPFAIEDFRAAVGGVAQAASA